MEKVRTIIDRCHPEAKRRVNVLIRKIKQLNLNDEEERQHYINEADKLMEHEDLSLWKESGFPEGSTPFEIIIEGIKRLNFNEGYEREVDEFITKFLTVKYIHFKINPSKKQKTKKDLSIPACSAYLYYCGELVTKSNGHELCEKHGLKKWKSITKYQDEFSRWEKFRKWDYNNAKDRTSIENIFTNIIPQLEGESKERCIKDYEAFKNPEN